MSGDQDKKKQLFSQAPHIPSVSAHLPASTSHSLTVNCMRAGHQYQCIIIIEIDGRKLRMATQAIFLVCMAVCSGTIMSLLQTSASAHMCVCAGWQVGKRSDQVPRKSRFTLFHFLCWVLKSLNRMLWVRSICERWNPKGSVLFFFCLLFLSTCTDNEASVSLKENLEHVSVSFHCLEKPSLSRKHCDSMNPCIIISHWLFCIGQHSGKAEPCWVFFLYGLTKVEKWTFFGEYWVKENWS